MSLWLHDATVKCAHDAQYAERVVKCRFGVMRVPGGSEVLAASATWRFLTRTRWGATRAQLCVVMEHAGCRKLHVGLITLKMVKFSIGHDRRQKFCSVRVISAAQWAQPYAEGHQMDGWDDN